MWNDGGNFGGGGGGGGGGFLESTFQSPSADAEKKTKDRRAENIVPVTVGQILSSGEEFRIAEVLVHVVTFVGRVKNIDMSSTKVTYLIDDFTGEIEALLWLEGPVDGNQPTLNSYCRISGTVRFTQGKRHVMIFNIKPVTDMNELTVHLLEVIDVFQNAATFMDDENTQSASVNTTNALPNSMMGMNQIDDGLEQHAPADPQQRMVFKVIADAAVEDEGGVDVGFITKKLNGRMGVDQVRNITDFLLHEGFIFSTIDDEHFTVTR